MSPSRQVLGKVLLLNFFFKFPARHLLAESGWEAWEARRGQRPASGQSRSYSSGPAFSHSYLDLVGCNGWYQHSCPSCPALSCPVARWTRPVVPPVACLPMLLYMIPTLPHAPTPFVLRLLFILQPLFLLPSTLPHDVSKAAGFTLVNHSSRTCHRSSILNSGPFFV